MIRKISGKSITQFHPLKYKTWNKGHIKGGDSKHTWRNFFG